MIRNTVDQQLPDDFVVQERIRVAMREDAQQGVARSGQVVISTSGVRALPMLASVGMDTFCLHTYSASVGDVATYKRVD